MNTGVKILASSFMVSVVTLMLISLYYYYYWIKLRLYLRKHRPDLIEFLRGNDLVGLNKISKGFERSRNWHFGDLGEEDVSIRYYKQKLKRASKIKYYILAITIIILLLIFIATLG